MSPFRIYDTLLFSDLIPSSSTIDWFHCWEFFWFLRRHWDILLLFSHSHHTFNILGWVKIYIGFYKCFWSGTCGKEDHPQKNHFGFLWQSYKKKFCLPNCYALPNFFALLQIVTPSYTIVMPCQIVMPGTNWYAFLPNCYSLSNWSGHPNWYVLLPNCYALPNCVFAKTESISLPLLQ